MGEWEGFLLSWQFEPTIVFGIAFGAWLYARGWRRLRRRGRGGRILKPWRAWCYAGGLAVVALALLSPIGTFDSIFFFMHMTQHVLLIMIAAPLLLLGAPLIPVMWAFDLRTRKRIGRWFRNGNPVHEVFHFLTRAPVALALFVLVVYVWHYPPLYDAAQGRTWIHDLEHALFFGSALLFWWPIIHPSGGKRRVGYGAGILYLFPAKVASFVLGAALTLSSEPFYQTYMNSPSIWRLDPLGDQQMGGLIMWVVGGLLYIIPLLFLVLMMMREDEGDVWVPEAVRTAAARGDDAGARPGTATRPAGAARAAGTTERTGR